MSGRADSWYAEISEENLGKLYSMARRGAQWFEVVKAANDELGLDVHPSRSGYYRWLDWMREQDSERRLSQARIAALEADQLAKEVGLDDETAIKAYKSLAAEMALKTGNAKAAGNFLRMATSLVDRQHRAKEISLKEKDLSRKEEELKIALKKLELLEQKENEAKGAISNPQLTQEEREQKLKEIFGL